MFRYRVFDLGLESDCLLPELSGGLDAPTDVCLRARVAHERWSPLVWVRRWNGAEGRTRLLAGKCPDGYCLCFPANAAFFISPDCREIRYLRSAAGHDTAFRHAFLDQVMPRLLAQRGQLVLHASAVDTAGGVLCFMGTPGHGKSTLAAAFHLKGARLIADDAALLHLEEGRMVCVPGYPGVRLWPDVAALLSPDPSSREPVSNDSEKLRCRLNGDASVLSGGHSIPLKAIVALRRQRRTDAAMQFTMRQVRGAEAVTELMRHAFKFDIGDQMHLAQIFAWTARVAAAVPVYLAVYASGVDLLPQLHAQIGRLSDDECP